MMICGVLYISSWYYMEYFRLAKLTLARYTEDAGDIDERQAFIEW